MGRRFALGHILSGPNLSTVLYARATPHANLPANQQQVSPEKPITSWLQVHLLCARDWELLFELLIELTEYLEPSGRIGIVPR